MVETLFATYGRWMFEGLHLEPDTIVGGAYYSTSSTDASRLQIVERDIEHSDNLFAQMYDTVTA